MACFYHIIKKSLFKNKRDSLISFLIEFFKACPNIVVVFDGARSIQKFETSLTRLSTTYSNAISLSNTLKKASSLARLSKSHHYILEDLKFKSYQVDAQDLACIRKRLESAGIQVVLAEFEADQYIAKKKNAIVISTDSDYYCYQNVETFIKFKFNNRSKKSTLVEFQMDDILRKLNVSREDLTFLAIVNKNDYTCNIPGMGFCTNLKWLKSASAVGVENLLVEYCKDFKVDV
jgi:5'-3' exonuclease